MDAILIAVLVGWGSMSRLPRWLESRRADSLREQSLLRARALLDTVTEYRALRSGDTAFVLQLQAAAPQLDAVARDARVFGDLVAVAGDTELGVQRYYIVEPHVLVRATLLAGVPPEVSIDILSSSNGRDYWLTSRRAKQDFNVPFIHTNHVPRDTSVARMLASHAAFLAAESVQIADLVSFDSLDHVARASTRANQHFVEWRHSEAPDTLLVTDLRFLLEGEFATSGLKWLQRLRKRSIPAARIHR